MTASHSGGEVMDESVDALDVAVAVERWVRRRPDHDAILASDGSAVTYAELWSRASGLAERLDVDDGEVVGVCFGRGVDAVVAMLAVLLAGGAYCPLGPDDPAERTDELRRRVGLRVVLVADGRGGIAIEASNVPRPVLSSSAIDRDRPVYVMWTSGSTGEPKAVVVPHRGVVRLMCDTTFMDLGPDDRVVFASNPMFDATTWEVWATLGNGGTVVVVGTDDLVDPARLRSRLESTCATRAFLTTSLFDILAARDPAMFGSLRSLAVGGEPLRPRTIRAVLESERPPTEVLNGYGPTECTTFAVTHRVGLADLEGTRVPIGRALHATELQIVDSDGRAVADGGEGELWIGGDGVASGYLVEGRLDQERFVEAEFDGRTARRWYRTGDLARVDERGLIDCLGRIDRQVKIRGYRIEPSEIEQHIAAIDGVVDVAVVPVRSETGTRLAAFVVLEEGAVGADVGGIRSSLRSSLPAYMVPTRVVAVEELPVTVNGKLDTDALLAMTSAGPRSTVVSLDGSEPLVRRIVEEARVVLGDPDIGAGDDLWDAGLDSLAVLELIDALRRTKGLELRPVDFIDHPTPLSIAGLVDRGSRSSVVDPDAVSSVAPLFVVPGGGATALVFRRLAEELRVRGRPLVVVEARGIHTGERPDRTIEEMAARVVDEVHRSRPLGPVLVAGWSGGGVIAAHAAWMLEQEGRDVRLVLFDVLLPGAGAGVERPKRGLRLRALGVAGTVRNRYRLVGLRRRARRGMPSRELYHEYFWIQRRAIRNYRATPRLRTPAAHFRVADSPVATTIDVLPPGSVEFDVAGQHLTMFDDPHVGTLATLVEGWIEESVYDPRPRTSESRR